MLDFFVNPRRMTAPAALMAGEKPPACAYEDDCSAPQRHQLTYELQGKVGVVNISGSIASESIPYWWYYGDNSYEQIIEAIDQLIANAAVESIILNFNSPGGTVTGCAEAAAAINDRSSEIEIVSFCRMADSAAYWLASATDQIVVDPTGEVGSVGVIMTHMDWSKMLEEWGIKVTHIFSGDHKADGSPFQPLEPDALARLQAEVDLLRTIFAENVAENRGMDVEEVKETQALTYIGATGVDIGLADSTAFLPDLISELSEVGFSNQTAKQEETSMARKTPKTAGKRPAANKAQTPKNASEQEDEDKDEEEAAAAEEQEDDEEEDSSAEEENKDDKDEDKDSDARSAERNRISAIVGCDEAKGKSKLANHLALKTDMSVDSAKAILANASKDEVPATNPLAGAMSTVGNPNIGTDGKGAQGANNPLLADMQKKIAAMK